MKNIYLSPYYIKVHPTGKPGELLELGKSCSDGSSLYDYLESKLNSLVNQRKVFDGIKKTISIKTVNSNRNDCIIEGAINSGEYGFSGSGYNVKTNKISFRQTTDDSLEYPFYYRIYIPNGKKWGILILERFGNSGIKDPFIRLLFDENEVMFDKLNVVINPLAISDVLQEFIKNGRTTELTVINNKPPPEYVKALGWIRGVGNKSKRTHPCPSVSLTISPDAGWSIGKIKTKLAKILSGKMDIGDLIELPDFSYDDACVTMAHDGKERRFYLSKDKYARTFLDVTQSVMSTNGHADYAKISAEGESLMNVIIKKYLRRTP